MSLQPMLDHGISRLLLLIGTFAGKVRDRSSTFIADVKSEDVSGTRGKRETTWKHSANRDVRRAEHCDEVNVHCRYSESAPLLQRYPSRRLRTTDCWPHNYAPVIASLRGTCRTRVSSNERRDRRCFSRFDRAAKV